MHRHIHTHRLIPRVCLGSMEGSVWEWVLATITIVIHVTRASITPSRASTKHCLEAFGVAIQFLDIPMTNVAVSHPTRVQN